MPLRLCLSAHSVPGAVTIWKSSCLGTEESPVCTFLVPQERQQRGASPISDRRSRSKRAYTHTVEIITTIGSHLYKGCPTELKVMLQNEYSE